MPGDSSGARRPVLGVVMLNTNFPRPFGDIGNPDSFDHPVLYHRVEMASATRVTAPSAADEQLRADILAAARALLVEGATLIATSCGFLGGLQSELSARLEVPVVTSSLVLLPSLETIYGAGRVGVLTFDARNLKPHHFPVAPVQPVPLAGLEQGRELHRVITQDLGVLDEEAAREDCLTAAAHLLSEAPGLRALLLECTNISPYRTALQVATGLPVYDILSAIDWIGRAERAYSSRGKITA